MMAIMPRLLQLSVFLLLLPEALSIDPFMNFKQPCKPFACSSSKVPVPKKCCVVLRYSIPLVSPPTHALSP